MLTNKPKFELNTEEKVVLSTALELFISNEIEGVSFKRKQDENILAISTLNKLSTLKDPFNAEDFRIMGVSLLYSQVTINETSSSIVDIKLDKDTDKNLSIISNLLDKVESILNTRGLSLYS